MTRTLSIVALLITTLVGGSTYENWNGGENYLLQTTNSVRCWRQVMDGPDIRLLVADDLAVDFDRSIRAVTFYVHDLDTRNVDMVREAIGADVYLMRPAPSNDGRGLRPGTVIASFPNRPVTVECVGPQPIRSINAPVMLWRCRVEFAPGEFPVAQLTKFIAARLLLRSESRAQPRALLPVGTQRGASRPWVCADVSENGTAQYEWAGPFGGNEAYAVTWEDSD